MYGTVPFVRQGSCFHPVPRPYYTLTAVFFHLQRIVLPVASECEAVHPPVWKSAEVCGRRGDLSNSWEARFYSWPPGWVVSYRRMSLMVPHLDQVPSTVKNKPPASFLCHKCFEGKRFPADRCWTVWTLSSLCALFSS